MYYFKLSHVLILSSILFVKINITLQIQLFVVKVNIKQQKLKISKTFLPCVSHGSKN